MWFLYIFLVSTGLIITEVESKEFSWRNCLYSIQGRGNTYITNCKGLKLESVPKDIFESPSQGRILLANNPYNCNCNMEWFVRKLRLRDFTQTLSDMMEMKCNKPAHLKSKLIYNLIERDVCPQRVKAVDECKLQLHKCHRHAHCLDRIDGYTCSCQTGFTGNGKSCADIDECKLTKQCPEHSRCRNTLGSYSCICNEGYLKINSKCQDMNECDDGTAVCHRHAVCENTPGSYRCTCKPGYFGKNGQNCVRKVVTSCSSNPSPCQGWMEECIDGYQPGEYECRCRAAFERSKSGDCKDVDECKTKTAPCDPIAECQNTEGSYKCICPEGYSNYGRTCIDVDECAKGEDNCHRDAVCVNTIGSFSCFCQSGFQEFKDGRLCLKEEEDEFNMTPVIVGSCVFVVLAIALIALILYVRGVRKRKNAISKKPLIKGKSKKNWLSNFMFPDIDRLPANESALTVWSDSDED